MEALWNGLVSGSGDLPVFVSEGRQPLPDGGRVDVPFDVSERVGVSAVTSGPGPRAIAKWLIPKVSFHSCGWPVKRPKSATWTTLDNASRYCSRSASLRALISSTDLGYGEPVSSSALSLSPNQMPLSMTERGIVSSSLTSRESATGDSGFSGAAVAGTGVGCSTSGVCVGDAAGPHSSAATIARMQAATLPVRNLRILRKVVGPCPVELSPYLD